MFRKKTDILLQTQSRLAKKDVHSLRQILQYCFANYTNSADEQLFGSSPKIDFLRFKSGRSAYKLHNGPPLIIGEGKDRYYPTVFALWKCNDIVPVIYTNSYVSEKIIGGAALMAPGVILPEEGLPHVLCNTVVAIAVKGNPYPFAVGYCCVNNLTEAVVLGKGRVVNIVHCYSDFLYSEYSSKVPLPDGYTPFAVLPISADQADLSHEPDDENEAESVNEPPKESTEDAPEESSDKPDDHSQESGHDEVQSSEQMEIASFHSTDSRQLCSAADLAEPSEDRCDISSEEMDKQFIRLCIRCLNDVKETELPMQVSTFNSKFLQKGEYVNRFCSSSFYCGDVVNGDKLRWNFTSFQKLPKLIHHLSESKLIVAKTVNNQLTIISINSSHPWLQEYRSYIEKHKQEAVKILHADNRVTDTRDVTQQAYYKVNARLAPLFELMNCSRASHYTLSSARRVLNDYIQTQGLASPENPGQVIIDARLSEALFQNGRQGGPITPTTMSRKDLVALFDKELIPYHSVVIDDKQVMKKGTCRKIDIVTQKVKGVRRFLTMVYNTSEFLIDTKELIRELSKSCAASCCEKTSPTGSYIQIQGKVEQQVKDVLIKHFKIPTKFINIKK